jgi:hypothetical protein
MTRPRLPFPAALALLAIGPLAGCGASPSQAPQTPRGHAVRRQHHQRRPRRHPPNQVGRAARLGTLAFSTASATVVQRQPSQGSCHPIGAGPYSRPDPVCTPGALNPAVTQSNIGQTICVSGWSESVRPAESVTEPEKLASMLAYGDNGPAGDYEYDHLVSLELGGAVNDRRNLWPEPGASPNPKDAVENALHRMVCSGEMQLAQAQRIIATNWVKWSAGLGSGSASAASHRPSQSGPPPASPSSGPHKPIAEVNCSDFSTHAAAQRWFEQHGGSPGNDVAGLDADHDGSACESLP